MPKGILKIHKLFFKRYLNDKSLKSIIMNSKSILTFIGFCLFFSTCKISDKNKVYDEEIDIQNIEIQSFINFVSLQEYENVDTTIPVSDMFGVPSEDCYYRFFTPNENYTVTLIFNKKEGINFRGSFSKKIKHTDEERFFPMDTLINRSYRDVYYIYNGKKEKMKLEYS